MKHSAGIHVKIVVPSVVGGLIIIIAVLIVIIVIIIVVIRKRQKARKQKVDCSQQAVSTTNESYSRKGTYDTVLSQFNG